MRVILRTRMPANLSPAERHDVLTVVLEETRPVGTATQIPPVVGTLLRWEKTAYTTPMETRMVLPMLVNFGELVPATEIVEHMYGDLESGGPDDAMNVLKVTLIRLRRKLLPLGVAVKTQWGRGYALVDAPPGIYVPAGKPGYSSRHAFVWGAS